MRETGFPLEFRKGKKTIYKLLFVSPMLMRPSNSHVPSIVASAIPNVPSRIMSTCQIAYQLWIPHAFSTVGACRTTHHYI